MNCWLVSYKENSYVANKFMDKRHMDEVAKKPATRPRNLFAAIGFGEIGTICL